MNATLQTLLMSSLLHDSISRHPCIHLLYKADYLTVLRFCCLEIARHILLFLRGKINRPVLLGVDSFFTQFGFSPLTPYFIVFAGQNQSPGFFTSRPILHTIRVSSTDCIFYRFSGQIFASLYTYITFVYFEAKRIQRIKKETQCHRVPCVGFGLLLITFGAVNGLKKWQRHHVPHVRLPLIAKFRQNNPNREVSTNKWREE